MFLKHFTLAEHLFAPREIQVRFHLSPLISGKNPMDLYGQGSLQTRSLTGRNLRISKTKKGLKPARWGDFLIAFFSKVFLFFFLFNMLVLISSFCVALTDEF